MNDMQLIGQLRRRYIKMKERIALMQYGGPGAAVPAEKVFREMDERLFGYGLDDHNETS